MMPKSFKSSSVRRANDRIVGLTRLGRPQVEVDEPEEWVEPPEVTSFGTRQSLWADWMARRFGAPYPRSCFVWDGGNPYNVVRGWDPVVRK